MRKITLTSFAFLLALAGLKAQSVCTDLNGYVDSKNTAGTGSYTLLNGFEEKAAQTYHYSGPGKINSVRVYGNYPGASSGVPLRISICNVDANGRPTSTLQSANATWWWFNNSAGYISVPLGPAGVYVSNDFAVAVEIRNASPWGGTFQLQYTGNGEGMGEDLASLAGTSTGNNWTSAMSAFNKDGDFYLVPNMSNFIQPDFSVSSSCVAVNAPVSFTNNSEMTLDPMFNTGATGSFYSWDFGDGSPLSNVVSPSHNYATAGSYTVTLTCAIDGWNNNCSASTTTVISVGLASSATAVSATCNGAADGSVTITGSGGSQPFEYQLGSFPYQGGNVFSNLEAGVYTAHVMDNVGCISTTTVTVTQPPAIVISAISSTNASCGSSNGSLLVTANGGTGTLQYQLNTAPYQSGNQFTALASGFYTINVKDANGCIATDYAPVNNQGAPVMTIVSTTNVSCNGGNDGSIVLSATGGSGTLMYSIDGGATWQTSGTFANVAGGMHMLVVKDANGCMVAVKHYTLQPDAISFETIATAATCNGNNDGSFTVTSQTGGTGNFVYSIDGINYQSSAVFTGLAAGNYTVYAKDVAGCIGTGAAIIGEPSPLTATANVTSNTCHGEYAGSVTLTVTGGIPGYSYSIDGENFQPSNVFNELPAGTYTITVRDHDGNSQCMLTTVVTISEPTVVTASITTGASSCGNANGTLLAIGSGGSGSGYQYSIDGTIFNSTGAFNSLQSGNYNVIVTDGNGCMSVFATSINDANGPVITSISHTDVSCYDSNDGTITINTVTGGSGTLYYSVNGSTWQTSNAFTNLNAGSYTVLVKDANGCVGQSVLTITEPNPIVVVPSVVNVTCYGDFTGQVTLNAAGGSGTLAYSVDSEWGFQSSNVFTNLYAGTFNAVVRDAAGCTGHATFTVTQPDPIIVTAGVLNVMCSGAQTGAIFMNASGGTGSFQYSLDGIFYQSGTSFTGLTDGNYTAYVKDANGCVQTLGVTVTEPLPLQVASATYDVACSGGNDGVIDLTVSGGTAPYGFTWSNNQSSEDIFNLAAGNYSVTVMDHNGCAHAQSFVINQPTNPLVVNGVITNASTQTTSDGSVDITITGGTGPYTFLWSNNATTEDVSGLLPGVYTVTITDNNGCVTSGIFTVTFAIGIEDHAAVNSVSLYPNPAHENFTVNATTIIDKLEVMNMLGEVVYTSAPKTSQVTVNTDVLSQGVYFVRVYTKNEMITRRVEVSK